MSDPRHVLLRLIAEAINDDVEDWAQGHTGLGPAAKPALFVSVNGRTYRITAEPITDVPRETP